MSKAESGVQEQVSSGDYPYGLDEEGIEKIQAVADSELPCSGLAEQVLEIARSG